MKRKTNKEFQQEIFDLVGDEYKFLDTYVNNKTKLRVKHNKCGHIYEVLPSNFLKGRRCTYCSGKMKKTNAQFKQEIYALVGNEYVFLESYVNNKAKLRVKHNRCGHIYKVSPSKFLHGRRCPYCAGLIKKTDAQFKQEVYDLVGNEYEFLDTYVNNRTKLRVKHNKCGYIYKVKPGNFLNGQRCPYCSGLMKKTNVQFKQEVFDLVGNEYVFLEPYQGAKTKIKVKHNKCGKIYEVQPSDFLQGSRCHYCFGNLKKTDSQFKQEVYNLVGNEYTFLDNYVNNHTKLKVKHNKCGNVYRVRPTSFLDHQTRCPYCNSPKGETIISKILDTLNVSYEYQKTFSDLKDTQPLSYDFFISDQNILIEYQGIQHYEPIEYFGGEAKFKLQQQHDKMKSDYAKAHHYNLIAVPYTEDTFSKIKKYLSKHELKLY